MQKRIISISILSQSDLNVAKAMARGLLHIMEYEYDILPNPTKTYASGGYTWQFEDTVPDSYMKRNHLSVANGTLNLSSTNSNANCGLDCVAIRLDPVANIERVLTPQ